MSEIRSWKFWVILALGLMTLACANREERRERREQAREERLERREAAREQRRARTETRRAEREEAAPPAKAQPALTPISTAPAADVAEAKVIFMRATNYGGAIAASIFDVTESGPAKFVGIVHAYNKIAYPVKPGPHTFMVVSEAADFMQATIVGGKTYYALITPRMGAWKARFSFKPVRAGELDGRQFAEWDRRSRLVTPTAAHLSWAKSNASSVEDKRDRWWPEWNNKPESQKDSQTLFAEDGR